LGAVAGAAAEMAGPAVTSTNRFCRRRPLESRGGSFPVRTSDAGADVAADDMADEAAEVTDGATEVTDGVEDELSDGVDELSNRLEDELSDGVEVGLTGVVELTDGVEDELTDRVTDRLTDGVGDDRANGAKDESTEDVMSEVTNDVKDGLSDGLSDELAGNPAKGTTGVADGAALGLDRAISMSRSSGDFSRPRVGRAISMRRSSGDFSFGSREFSKSLAAVPAQSRAAIVGAVGGRGDTITTPWPPLLYAMRPVSDGREKQRTSRRDLVLRLECGNRGFL